MHRKFNVGEYYKWPTRCNNNNFIDLWIWSTCFGKFFAHFQERKTVVYSNVVYCSNVVVGWRRSGERRRRLCVRCEVCCSRNYNISSIHHIAVNHSLTLLKMGKKFPETCWPDSKINKIVMVASSLSFVLFACNNETLMSGFSEREGLSCFCFFREIWQDNGKKSA
jgi:hypothetical protein